MIKQDKKHMVKEQHGRCGLCRHTFSVIDQVCLDELRGRVLCRKCMLLMSSIRNGYNRGVTMDLIQAYGRLNLEQIQGTLKRPETEK